MLNLDLYSKGLQRLNHLILQEALGDDTWERMNSALQNRLSNDSKPDARAAIADARAILNGNKDLQDRFDVIFKDVSNETVALGRDIAAKSTA